MDYRLPRNKRIRRRGEIRRMFRRGFRAADETLRLIAAPAQDGEDLSRCGVIITVRHGNAVRRNRIKRLCREAFRLVSPRIAGGMDYLMCPHIRAEADLDSLMQSLENLAAKITRSVGHRNRPGAGEQVHGVS